MTIAVKVYAPGGPKVLQVEEITVPEPKLGEVQIEQSVMGVNFVDIYYRNGLYPLPSMPATLGFEGAGRIVAVGPGVGSLCVGDRVAYAGMPMGAYTAVRNLPEQHLIRLPDTVSDRLAGSSMLRGLTAHMLLNKVYAVQPGDWILVHAAAGGLGQILVRWAKHLGAHVIGTVGSGHKVALAEDAGADAVFLHGDPTWVDKARQLADGQGVHLAVDGIGGSMLAQTLACIRQFGLAVSLGQAAGPIPPVRVEELGFSRSIALMRPSFMAYANHDDLYRKGAADLLAAFGDWFVNPIGAEYGLDQAAKAHADLEAGRTTGSVILKV